MIPEFPEFKKLELKDKEDIQKITLRFKPYSDFNFTSMWSWNIKDEMMISMLNDNLVVKFSDYVTTNVFYSFLGNNKINDTIDELIDFSIKNNSQPLLKLIPEESIIGIDSNKYNFEYDRDGFDYIYKLDHLITMDGGEFSIKRKQLRYFQKNFQHNVRSLDLNNLNTKDEILNLFSDWVSDKDESIPSEYFVNEYEALKKFLDFDKSQDFYSTGIYVDNKLCALSIIEKISDTYCISHFQKTRIQYKGIGPYINYESAKQAKLAGAEYFNYEQDLGIKGLRENKESYSPIDYLKKYTVSKKQN